MRMLPVVSVLVLISSVMAGCAGNQADEDPIAEASDSLPWLLGFTPLPALVAPIFAPPVLVDTVRAGGEPVIAITHSGAILVSAHPGFTHYHPSDEVGHVPTEIVTPVNAQSYLWRSTDNGTTWTHIGLPTREEGPRSAGFGVSDPEFTVMDDGTICYTDLEALAMASTTCSMDDGLTWLPGNPIASGRPVDRQWLASLGDEFYFTANYLGSPQSLPDFRASTDGGLTWEERGRSPCNGDVVGNRVTGHLVQGCGSHITVSEDGARTWSERLGPADHSGSHMTEPAIDSAGNVWTTWEEREGSLWAAGSPDEGKTWPWLIDLTPHVRLFKLTEACRMENGTDCASWDAAALAATQNGTYVWPWISAGSDGRFAVTWIASYSDGASSDQQGPWHILTAFVLNATSTAPTVIVSRMTPEPMHNGPICQSGTGCQVGSVQGDASSDRRLGDFFETTIGPDGYLYGAWSNTATQPLDVISHPQFVRQTGGVRLIADAELGVFKPTQG